MRATQATTRAPGLDAYCVSLMERGTSQAVQPGSVEPAMGNAEIGLIFGGEPGTRLAASDDSARFNLWVPARLLRERLEALLDGQKVGSLVFQPLIDQTRGAGATIRRLLSFLFVELAHSDSLLTNEIVTGSIEETLALCLLLGLTHNYRYAALAGAEGGRSTRQCAESRGIHACQCLRAADDRGDRTGCRVQRSRSADGFPPLPRHDADGGLAADPARGRADRDAARRSHRIFGPDCRRAWFQ
jgi:hypothetical protein